MDEVEEGADVEDIHLRGAGVGGIIAFFVMFLSNARENQQHTMIDGQEMTKNFAALQVKYLVWLRMTDMTEGLT